MKKVILNSPEWIISISVFFTFWLVNKSFTGPAYLTDEIGYLANAALISGHIIDGANSWHAGYSFILAPLFIIFTEPSDIWQAAMVLNAIIWSISFLLLARIIEILQPKITKRQLFMALLLSAAYPAWITMSGFVFATTAFVFVYLLSILVFLHWKPESYLTIIPHALMVGYLYWIHPIGLSVGIASFLVIGFISIKEKKYASAILGVILVLILIIGYREIIDKWLIILATPEGYEPLSQHYPDSDGIYTKLFKNDFWIRLVSMSVGQTAYLIVSTFGLAFFGFFSSINHSYHLIKKNDNNNDKDTSLIIQATFLYLSLSLLAVLASGALLFSIITSNRIDLLIYGRYTEMVILPLIALGYLSQWSKKLLLLAALFVITSGLLLSFIADMSAWHNFINTISFWPKYVIPYSNFIYWMFSGAVLMFLMGRVRNDSKLGNNLVFLCMVIVFMLSSTMSHFGHHQWIYAHSKPSAFGDIIRVNYLPGTCVGFNPKIFENMYSFQAERYHLQLFYLYDYAYRRMTPNEWLENCDGPYFTFHLEELHEIKNVELVGKEMFSKIYMVVKGNSSSIALPDKDQIINEIYLANGWNLDYKINYEGTIIENMVGPVGYYKNGSIYSQEDAGLMLTSSNTQFGSGKYYFMLKGHAVKSDEASVEIISGRGENLHVKLNIDNNYDSNNIILTSGTFILEKPVLDLQVKVYVNVSDNLRIDGYEIKYLGELLK